MPSEAYERALRATQRNHARQKTFSGRFLVRYLPDIEKLIAENGYKTLLDYGCGRGVQWADGELEKRLGVTVTKYDPGVPAFSAEPGGKFDIVICTQVLGSIPVGDLPWVIDRICCLAKSCVYIGERLGPVRKRIHKDLAEDGLMPHGWTHEQWFAAIYDVTRGAYLRTKDKRTGVTRLEQVW